MKSFLIALSTLTAFPSMTSEWTPTQLKRSVIFYPVVGMLLGGILALVGKCPLPNSLQALLVLLLWVLLTLAFHLDGWGDCLDGWFGGHNPEERRRIMKDAAVGVYGVTGIVLLLLAKFVLLENLVGRGDAWKWLIAVPASARFAVVVSCLTSWPPPGEEGLGAKVLGLSFPAFFISLFLTFGLWPLLEWNLLRALTLSALVSLGVSSLSKRKIGGLTGDGMGATVELAEVSLLFLAFFQAV